MHDHTSNAIWERLKADAATKGAAIWQLIDPDKTPPEPAADIAAAASNIGCDAFLVGASTGSPDRFAAVTKAVKAASDKPVLIFPNGAAQVNPHADAILFMALLSGRNPDFLIGEQVKGAPRVARYNLEAIPTAYLLIESGHVTTVQKVSGTKPIPRDDVTLARDHCLAARYFGMRLTYLEAGSGAVLPVPELMVDACAATGMAIAVGGGIRQPEQAARFVAAGATFIVIGTRFEPEPDWNLYKEFVDATHTQETAAR